MRNIPEEKYTYNNDDTRNLSYDPDCFDIPIDDTISKRKLLQKRIKIIENEYQDDDLFLKDIIVHTKQDEPITPRYSANVDWEKNINSINGTAALNFAIRSKKYQKEMDDEEVIEFEKDILKKTNYLLNNSTEKEYTEEESKALYGLDIIKNTETKRENLYSLDIINDVEAEKKHKIWNFISKISDDNKYNFFDRCALFYKMYHKTNFLDHEAYQKIKCELLKNDIECPNFINFQDVIKITTNSDKIANELTRILIKVDDHLTDVDLGRRLYRLTNKPSQIATDDDIITRLDKLNKNDTTKDHPDDILADLLREIREDSTLTNKALVSFSDAFFNEIMHDTKDRIFVKSIVGFLIQKKTVQKYLNKIPSFRDNCMPSPNTVNQALEILMSLFCVDIFKNIFSISKAHQRHINTEQNIKMMFGILGMRFGKKVIQYTNNRRIPGIIDPIMDMLKKKDHEDYIKKLSNNIMNHSKNSQDMMNEIKSAKHDIEEIFKIPVNSLCEKGPPKKIDNLKKFYNLLCSFNRQNCISKKEKILPRSLEEKSACSIL